MKLDLIITGFLLLTCSAGEAGEPKIWISEGTLRFHSIGKYGTPLVGTALSYGITDDLQIGLRPMLSMSGNKDYLAAFFARRFFSENRQHIFLELSGAYNYIDRSGWRPSFSADVGYIHKTSGDVGFGGSAGVEAVPNSTADINFPETGLYAYPRIAAIICFDF